LLSGTKTALLPSTTRAVCVRFDTLTFRTLKPLKSGRIFALKSTLSPTMCDSGCSVDGTNVECPPDPVVCPALPVTPPAVPAAPVDPVGLLLEPELAFPLGVPEDGALL